MAALQAVALIAGVLITIGVLFSAVETVVLPRRGFTRITRLVFAISHRVLVWHWRNARRRRDSVALFAPVALVSIPLMWVILILIAFALFFWGTSIGDIQKAFVVSGSSLLTLGFDEPHGIGRVFLTFVEAAIGLGLVALLISYLPTLYTAYNAREKGVKLLRPLAGSPPSTQNLLERIGRMDESQGSTLWSTLWNWLIDLEQSHSSFPALCYFQGQSAQDSWVASVGVVLDTCALMLSVEPHRREQIQGPFLAMVHGGPALVEIARAVGLPVGEPRSVTDLLARTGDDPPDISVTRGEYEQLLEAARRADRIEIGQVTDTEHAWRAFAWLRFGYDKSLRGLAGLSYATAAPLTTDRPARVGRPRLVGTRPLAVDWSIATR